MRILFGILTLAVPLMVGAMDLDCQVSMNALSALKVTVKSELGLKKSVGDIQGTAIYLTEKSGGIFELEAFVPESEIRLYSSSTLSLGSGPLTLALWGRDRLMDIGCRILPAK